MKKQIAKVGKKAAVIALIPVLVVLTVVGALIVAVAGFIADEL